MKFGNFMFTESRDPAREGEVLDEVLAEVRLTEQLGFDTVWLGEHHFDGSCAYVDPVSFAAAIAAMTSSIRIGLAVAQMSLHHPIRLAEQLSLIDHISKGRLLVGLGRGTAYNIYEYQGFGIEAAEAQARFEEATAIVLQAWTSEGPFQHHGRFWDLDVPVLRPRPFTRPHPFTIHAAASEASLVELGRAGKPFLMNVQNAETTRARIAAWRGAAQAAGFGAAHLAAALEQSWVWRNVFVADTDAEAERTGLAAFTAMGQHRSAMRNRVAAEKGVTMASHGGHHAAAKIDPRQALIFGAPATVAADLAEIEAMGVGGVICAFRLGPLSYADTARSLTLFAEEVVPLLARQPQRRVA